MMKHEKTESGRMSTHISFPPKVSLMEVAFLLLALGLGFAIGWVDTRPTWDDAGITVAAILIVAAAFGLLMPRRAWVWGLAVGIGTPLLNFALHGDLRALVALPVAFLGSYAGAIVRKATGA